MASVYITSVNSTGNVDPGFSLYLVDASTNNVTLTLPDILSDGTMFMFRRIDNINGNSFTLQGYNLSQTIDGNASVTFATGTEGAVVSYNGVWWRW